MQRLNFALGGRRALASISVLVFLLTVGCDYRVQHDPSGALTPAEGGLATGALVDYSLVQNTVLVTCQSCHAGQTQPALNSLQAVRASANLALSEVEGGDMPPPRAGYQPLSACQQAILRKWIELGTPETSDVTVGSLSECAQNKPGEPNTNPNPGDAAGDTSGDTAGGAPGVKPIGEEALTYQTFLTRILQPKCMSCHSPGGDPEASGILFYPYSELKSHKRLFTGPGKKSKFVRLVTRRDGNQMPPPEATVAPLTQEEVDFAIRWIDAGLPE